jgi:hypothetical protein
MTLESLIQILSCHLAALQSTTWRRPSDGSIGPVVYFDEADTEAAIMELKRVQMELEIARARPSQVYGRVH